MDEGNVLRDWEQSTLIIIYNEKGDPIQVRVISGDTAVRTWNEGIREGF